MHASLIEGGQEKSTYPATCVAKLERRTVPGEDGPSCQREIEHLDPRANTKVMLDRAPSELAADHPLSRAVAEAAGHPEAIGVPYWMDMALLNAARIPTVAFGPIGQGAHADVEWVDLSSVEECVGVYRRVLERLCS